MKKIALIVDSSSGIKNGQYPHVYVLPMIITEQQGSNIISYRDGVDITVNQLSRKLEAGADIKTSQANVKEMFDLVESVKKDYEKVFVLPIPSTISGNYNSWLSVANEFKNVKIYPQFMIGRMLEWAIIDIVEMIKSDSLNESTMQTYLDEIHIKRIGYMIVPDMKQLVKGGRISNFKSLLIKVMSIKLLITLNEKGLSFFDKASNYDDSVKKIHSAAQERLDIEHIKIKRCVIFHNTQTNPKFKTDEIVDKLKAGFPNITFEIYEWPAIILAHVGPNAVAIAFDPE